MIHEYEIEYNDGSKERIQRQLIHQYQIDSPNTSANPGFTTYGVGCGVDYIIESLRLKKPIIVARNLDGPMDSNIEKIINMHNVKTIRPITKK